MNKKVIISISLLVSLILFQIPTKSEATLMGGRWTTNIYVYVDHQGNPDILGSFDVARTIWNDELSKVGANVRIYKAYTASEANVIVKVQDYLGSAVALTDNYPTKYSLYTGGKITINLNKFKDLQQIEKSSVATHELGHILGLAHTTNTDDSIMVEYLTGKIYPTAYDRGELNKIY